MKRQIKRFVSQMLFVTAILPVAGLTSVVLVGQTKPDNTAANKTDNPPTADQQGITKADADVTRRIRKAIMADKTLSTYAHNVKIVTVNGMVTLKGPVRSDHERTVIEGMAKNVAGDSNVADQIEIAPAKSN